MKINQEKRRIKRHRQIGEEFTPIPLVNEMLDKLPPELFTDPLKRFLDPACGNGNFLIEILKRRMNYMSPLQAISNIYGCDIMKDNIRELRERMYILIPKGTMTVTDIKGVVKYLLKNFLYVADALEFNFCFPSKASNENIELFYNNHLVKNINNCIIERNKALYDTKSTGTTKTKKANGRRLHAA